MNYYVDVWRKYAVFDGRSRGKEFWFFALIHFIALCALDIVGMMLSGGDRYSPLGTGLTAIYSLAALVPAVAVTVRRLHDTDKTGWLALLYFIPFFGAIVVLVLCAMPGTIGPNRYGADPTDTHHLEAAVV